MRLIRQPTNCALSRNKFKRIHYHFGGCGEKRADGLRLVVSQVPTTGTWGNPAGVLSHPCARKKAQGWGTGHLCDPTLAVMRARGLAADAFQDILKIRQAAGCAHYCAYARFQEPLRGCGGAKYHRIWSNSHGTGMRHLRQGSAVRQQHLARAQRFPPPLEPYLQPSRLSSTAGPSASASAQAASRPARSSRRHSTPFPVSAFYANPAFGLDLERGFVVPEKLAVAWLR